MLPIVFAILVPKRTTKGNIQSKSPGGLCPQDLAAIIGMVSSQIDL